MKLRLQVFLIILTILGVAGFQLFWLKQTYIQEKKTLAIKTDFAFRNALQQLQVSKLKFESSPGDTAIVKKIKLSSTDTINQEFTIRLNEKKGILSTINVISKKVNDSFSKNPLLKNKIFISRDQTLVTKRLDDPGTTPEDVQAHDHLIRLLYGVDSLQDSLKLVDIKMTLKKILINQEMDIPFTIQKLDSTYKPQDPALNEVTTGFAHPTTYKLIMGNTSSYLLRRIGLPIFFSILLLAITIISFFLLYRNLLQQKRLTAIKNEFIGNITHELKTPISTVSVAIEAMKNFNALQSPERTQEYLDISANELQRLSLLVDKVLSLSKFEKNEIEIKKENFDFVQLIREVMESMKPQFEKQEAATSLQLTGINFIIEADRRHISSVVYNLLDNALKYSMKDPQIAVHVIDHSQYLELRVTDNGIGIPAEYNRKIFEQFFRVPAGDTHNIKGYGLGLSYVNYIVASHQGFIEVESEINKGSTFIIKIPFKEADVIYYDNNRKVIRKHFKL
jgi:two-component system phosphate regulon sensor histidine kinase PhoR